MNDITTTSRWNLIEEGPYRLFFPLGVLAGLAGVGHWMLWSVGFVRVSDPHFHEMMQVEGFLTSFALGALMTALPRFMGAPPATWRHVISVGSAMIATLVALQLRFLVAAQLTYAAAWLAFAAFAIPRFRTRQKSPPASFIFVAFGIVDAIAGSLMIAASRFGSASATLYQAGEQLLFMGFMLSLVLGFTAHLTPFLMGYAPQPDRARVPSLTTRRVSLHAGFALLLTGSCFLTPGAPRLSAAVRALIGLVYLLGFARIMRRVENRKVFAYFFWLSCWMVLAGLVAEPIWPTLRIAIWHILFIGGFSLMIFNFGAMVVFSHGSSTKMSGRMIPLWVLGIAMLAATVLRVLADVDVTHYKMWIHAASGTWWIVALAWLIYLWPDMTRRPAPDAC